MKNHQRKDLHWSYESGALFSKFTIIHERNNRTPLYYCKYTYKANWTDVLLWIYICIYILEIKNTQGPNIIIK